MSTARIFNSDRTKCVHVGPLHTTKVMALIGTNSRRSQLGQIAKLDALVDMSSPPDVIADLSIAPSPISLVSEISERGFPVAALPVYSISRRTNRIDRRELLSRCVELVESGVRLLTIHPTASADLISLARRRLTPWTSRGGGLIIRDLVRDGVAQNAYLDILPELIDLARKFEVTVSIGATFRSANIFDSFDAAQKLEIESQIALAKYLKEAGVMCIIESPGHARPSDIALIGRTLRAAGYPVMPLGPIPTDTAVGQDHISSAIGATLFGLAGSAHMLAAVTREEHTGGVPSTLSTIEAVQAAKVAAHVIDLGIHGADEDDRAVADERAKYQTCVISRSRSGCSRCLNTCPLIDT